MADTFTRDPIDWLDHLAFRRDMPASAFKVAFVIADILVRQGNEPCVALDVLAKRASMSERTVSRATKALCKAGYLSKRRSGFGQPNLYGLCLPMEARHV